MATHGVDDIVRIELLGGFRVLRSGREAPENGWPLRRAAELVQLLALARDQQCLRDQVIDALWPHLDAAAGAANLRKAAHHARQALGDHDAVMLRGGRVLLFPSREIETDVDCFERAATAALRGDDADVCAKVATTYTGDLLPDALYEEWTQARREHLRARYRELLRRGRSWARLVEAEPTDEPAYRELMSAALADGNRHAAIRWYGKLRTALAQELGMVPSRESEVRYEQCVAGLRPADQDIVGRQVELAHVEAAFRSAERGDLGALVVRGPAGIGKSTLCRQAVALARSQSWLALAVTATPEGGPYAPLVEAVEQVLSRERGLLDTLPDAVRSVLAELTMLAAPAPPLEAQLTRHHVIGAVRRVLLGASPDSRITLVVDDAHLADDSAIEVILHLAGMSGGGGLFVVLAYRPELARSVLARGVARLERARVAAPIDLAPLDHEDAAALIAAESPTPPDSAVVTQILDLAGGNPFFLLELLRNAVAGGLPGRTPTVWEAVATRFVDLDEGTRAMLQRLAVAGGELDPAGVIAVTGLPDTDAFALLDAALAAGVLIVSGTCYRFRHELVRQALVEEVPPHRRVAVHRDAARRLATAGGTPDAIAAHWLAGGRAKEALPWLLVAARHAVKLGAFGDALTHLDSLLDHAPEHAEALCLRAEALEVLGDERAPVAYAAAARVADEQVWHDIRAKQALASVRAGDPAGAVAALEGVEARSLDGRLAQALAMCGAAAMGFADPAVGVAKAAETRRLAVESGEPAAIVIASWAEAAAAHAKGDLPRALLAGLRETYALPELAITVFDGQLCVAERLLYGGRPYDEVIAFADALGSEAQRLGAARGHAFATTFRGEAMLLTGRLDEADEDLTSGARLHQAIGASAGQALSLQRRAEVALYRGDRAQAYELLDESLSLARESNLGFHLLDRIYGTRIFAASDPAEAMAELEEAEDAVHGSMETCPGCRITLAVPAAIAAARAGDLDRAAGYEATAEQLTTILMRLPGWYAALDEVKGHRTRAAGDSSASTAHFAAAADGFRKAGQPLDALRCEQWTAGAH